MGFLLLVELASSLSLGPCQSPLPGASGSASATASHGGTPGPTGGRRARPRVVPYLASASHTGSGRHRQSGCPDSLRAAAARAAGAGEAARCRGPESGARAGGPRPAGGKPAAAPGARLQCPGHSPRAAGRDSPTCVTVDTSTLSLYV
jgi:hypothetical protein